MDVDASKVTYAQESAVVPTGGFVFTEPHVYQCIQDSISAGSQGWWSILVDIVPYTTALALAKGLSEDEAAAEARDRYLRSLAQFDVDSFEAELFWDTYQDVEASKDNPYAADEEAGYASE